jgi:transcription elongation factor Elf1
MTCKKCESDLQAEIEEGSQEAEVVTEITTIDVVMRDEVMIE